METIIWVRGMVFNAIFYNISVI